MEKFQTWVPNPTIERTQCPKVKVQICIPWENLNPHNPFKKWVKMHPKTLLELSKVENPTRF